MNNTKYTIQPEISPEELMRREQFYTTLDYYGIPYLEFDDNNKNNNVQKTLDRNKAMLLILKGEPIPKDLETRLLQYKSKDKLNNQVKQYK